MGAGRKWGALVVTGALALAPACGGGEAPAEAPKSRTVRVPSVSGKKLRAARNLIQARGLKVKVITEPFEELPAGTVIDEDPPAGKMAKRGDVVTLTVAEEKKK